MLLLSLPFLGAGRVEIKYKLLYQSNREVDFFATK